MTSYLQVAPIDKPFDIDIEQIAADKSISHRVAILSLLTNGVCHIDNYLCGEDTLHTLHIIEQLGAEVIREGGKVQITPPQTIKEPTDILYCGNAGTAIRLLCGFLAAQKDKLFILNGDSSIRSRPMKRIIEPLNSYGANIYGRAGNTLAPIVIKGRTPQGFNYTTPVASAQIKSAMLFFALFANQPSMITERRLTRDHSEILLKNMGADITTNHHNSGQTIAVSPLKQPLQPINMHVPADPSSAFFFAVAAAITKGAKVRLKGILLNKTRIEAFKVLAQMGTIVRYEHISESYESVGDIVVEYAPLKGIEISDNMAWLIDEIPAIAIACLFAQGRSHFKNAAELRVKESDRIKSVVNNLKLYGAIVEEFDDGFAIEGEKFIDNKDKSKVDCAIINSFDDHRVAMSFAILGVRLGAKIMNIECINTSFPNFISILQTITPVTVENKGA